MTTDQLKQVRNRLSAFIGPGPSLVAVCEWMLTDSDDRDDGIERHASLIMPPVPSTTPHLPDRKAAAPSFAALLLNHVNDRYEGDAPLVYKQAGVPRQIYHKIITNEAAAITKRTAIRFVFALRLPLDEAEAMLKAAGFAFSDAIAEDVVLKACLSADPPVHDFKDVDALLKEYGVEYAYST